MYIVNKMCMQMRNINFNP